MIDLDSINKKIRQAIADTLPAMGALVVKRIVATARTGKTMKDGEAAPLKPLSEGYKQFRQEVADNAQDKSDIKAGYLRTRDARGGEKSSFTSFLGSKGVHSRAIVPDPEFFSVGRSNLTLEGTFLSSIKVTDVDNNNFKVSIAPTGENREISNLSLGAYLEKQGRSIWGLDKAGRAQCAQLVKQAIRKTFLKNR